MQEKIFVRYVVFSFDIYLPIEKWYNTKI